MNAASGISVAAHHFLDLCKEKRGVFYALRHYLMWIKVFAASHS